MTYRDIVDLRALADSAARGYRFEQGLREILPWDIRPPLAALGESEQFDALFEWNHWHFIVEAKAKRKPINRGHPDWEDFELKVRRRHRGCIGLFCSLYPVAARVVTAARDLNREGYVTLVVAGEDWLALAEQPISFGDLLRFMILRARATFEPAMPTLSAVREWLVDHESASTRARVACQRFSATFLRRHKIDHHSDLYIERALDRDLASLAEQLRPSRLTQLDRIDTVDATEHMRRREPPHQLCIFRDASGAGKTTASVQAALNAKAFLGCAVAANQPNIDNLEHLLASIGDANGLDTLRVLDKPLLIAIDSLDEARFIANKHAEVISLLRHLDALNTEARSAQLLAFPLCFLFTIREDYWDAWAGVFEGQRAVTLRKRFSRFSAGELAEAIERYCKVFGYSLATILDSEVKEALSVPFNLQIFSEANAFQGPLDVATAFPENVLDLYFARKRDDISSRHVPSLTSSTLMPLLWRIALDMVRRGKNLVAQADIIGVINGSMPVLAGVEDQVLLALTSEQILAIDDAGGGGLRFRHLRFIEYLVAYGMVKTISDGKPSIDALDAAIYRSPIVSMFRVHECIRHIAKSELPDVAERITDHYSQSEQYMRSNVSRLRVGVAYGERTADEDVVLLVRSGNAAGPGVSWEGFFVLAARRNAQPTSRVLEAFRIAWEGNEVRRDRWKMLLKLADRGCLMEEQVMAAVFASPRAKDWEVFLGRVLQDDLRGAFVEAWREVGGPELLAEAASTDIESWRQVRRLLEIASSSEPYIEGLFNI